MTIAIALFKNDKKENDKQPDYKGWDKETGNSVVGWLKEASNGSKYFSLVFKTGAEEAAEKAKYQQGQGQQQNNQQPSGQTVQGFQQQYQQPQQQQQAGPDVGDSFDDDIPF